MPTTLVTPATVAKRAGISTVAVLKAIREGRLKARPVTGPDGQTSAWAITAQEAARFLAARTSSIAIQTVGAD